MILILREGIPRPTGNFPENLSRRILARRFLVGRLGKQSGARKFTSPSGLSEPRQMHMRTCIYIRAQTSYACAYTCTCTPPHASCAYAVYRIRHPLYRTPTLDVDIQFGMRSTVEMARLLALDASNRTTEHST